ncbi:hypothetical protein LSCM4_06338 [Leishmania orientalis]|uniref:6-phosphofructo-2-kinase domain-containing protein n=1 Tax=Leishmania orientalis TaxID=2249476 RepID=A0A836HIK2_9TRYP|nr:hypothetical protein LSCM4_06338 [Leishmania orientalis]
MEPNTVVTTPPPPPPGADAAAFNKDAMATVTRHANVQRSCDGANAVPRVSASGERIVAPVRSPCCCPLTAAVPATRASSATSHVNAAVPQDVPCPAESSAVEAEQLFYSFSHANKEPPGVGIATTAMVRHGGLRCCSRQLQHRPVTDPHADTVAAEDSTPCPHQVRHHHHYHCHRARHGSHRSHLEGAVKAVTATDTAPTAFPSISDRSPRASSRDLPLIQHTGTSEGSFHGDCSYFPSNTGSHTTRDCDNLPAHCSAETSLTTSQTSVSAINTGNHTLLSQVPSCIDREATVERIVGHRPRPYHRWRWCKAEDYQALHALNAHNSVYQPPPTTAVRPAEMEAVTKDVTAAHSYTAFQGLPAASLTPSPADTSSGVSPGSGKASFELPLSAAPSGASSSTVPRVVSLLDAGASASSAGRCATADDSPPKGTTAATSSTNSPSRLQHLPSAGGAKLRRVSFSPAANEMPFELMSRLSVYTIPTSQQGPAYFKTAVEDGTKTLVIFMMGLPARGKTFLAQKICRLLGWHGSRAKVQNIQVAWRRVLLDWEATHPTLVERSASPEVQGAQEAGAPAGEMNVVEEMPGDGRGASPGVSKHTMTAGGSATDASMLTAATAAPAAAPVHSDVPPSSRLVDSHSTQYGAMRAVCDFVTGPLNVSLRRVVTTSMSGGSASASTSGDAATRATVTAVATASAAATAGYSCGCSCSLSDTGVASGRLSSASTSIVCRDRSATSVCPSMLAHTTASLEDSATISAPTAACAAFLAETRFLASPVADVITSSPCSVSTRHSPTAATSAEIISNGGVPSLEASAGMAPLPASGANDSKKREVLRTRHFRELIEQPTSVARRLYRYVLQSFADDCRLYFQYGGEVVVVNDDFITEELRQEAEKLFRPLAAQFFYIEVIRDAEEDPLDFVQCKIRDPIEYPIGDIDPASAADDFHERLRFLESVYETLEGAPKAKKSSREASTAFAAAAAGASAASANVHSAKTPVENDTALVSLSTTSPRSQHRPPSPPPPSMVARSYVKIINANTIETRGISGYLASRIISYVMNLSQVKIQHPIYFVRHGESFYDVEDRIGGNPSLTEHGLQDAVALLEFLGSLKRHLEHVDHVQRAHQPKQQLLRSEAVGDNAGGGAAAAPSSSGTANTLEIWTSQLQRAIQTAELSEHMLDIRTLRWSSLNEIHAGVCEDMTYAEVRERYPLIDYFRKRNKFSFRYPEGESYQDLVARLEPVIMELENADKVVVVVAHQAVLRCLLAYFGSTSAESTIGVRVPRRTIWRCTYDSKGIASLDELRLDGGEAEVHAPKGKGFADGVDSDHYEYLRVMAEGAFSTPALFSPATE